MATCQIPGHPDSYGLGIRLALYLQWFGMILAAWLSPADALNFKFLHTLTVTAVVAGLALDTPELQPAEVYVVLLLACGALYFFVPVWLWRSLTCCRPWWDTGRWGPMPERGWLFRAGTGLLAAALLGLQVWFWAAGVYDRPAGTADGSNCVQYGFLFGQVRLNSASVIAVGIIISLVMLLVGAWNVADWAGVFEECRWYRRRKRRRWRMSQSRIDHLQQLRTISDIIVAAILTMAIELVISWNHISGVDDLGSAAQLIPSVISGAYLLRSIYIWLLEPPPGRSPLSDFPFFPGGSFHASANGYDDDQQARGNIVYIGSMRDWDNRRRHWRNRNDRRHSAPAPLGGMDPLSSPYSPMGAMGAGYPQMSAAGVPQEPAAAATAHGRHATVVDQADDIYSANV